MAGLILASGSARRRELLEQLGLSFTVVLREVDETPHANEPVSDYVRRLAQAKASAMAADHAHDWVVAADTTVSRDGEIFGKPADLAEALGMWQRLQGGWHQVWSGVAVAHQGQLWCTAVCTEVYMQALRTEQMQAYWRSGEPLGKAGGYAIQGRAAAFIPEIRGSYSSVVGLPLAETMQLLRQAGFAPAVA